MAKYDLLESMRRTYELASRGYIHPDAMIAAESWFRFRMGDEAFERALLEGRAIYVDEEVGADYSRGEISNG